VNTIHVGAQIRVPWHLVDAERIIRELTIRNKTVEAKLQFGTPLAKGDELDVELYENDTENDCVLLPRGYPIPFVSEDFEVVDERPAPTPKTTKRICAGTLRPRQIPAAEALDAAFGQDKLLCLGCGVGKNFLALRYFMRNFGGRCLIVVDREFVADQWDERILDHCFIDEVGRIGTGRCDMGDIFTVAMIHTLAKDPDTFNEEFFAQFDLVVFDEVHITSANSFRPVIRRVPGERLGLTATPNRKDELDPCFRLHLGGYTPVYTDIARTMPCTWIFKKLPPLLKGFDLKRCYRRLNGAKRKDPETGEQEQVYALMRPRYETSACKNEFWFKTVVEDLIKGAASGRQIILLGGRTEHLGKVVDTLNERGVSAGLVVGAVKTKDRKHVFQNNQVICATWQLASRALDLPRLDTLFLLFPTSDAEFLQQASGRIDDRAATGEKKPLVVTYCHKPLDSREDWFAKTGRGRRGATYEMIETLKIVDKEATIRFVNVEE
jgi:superfamily II DNA or RNA helicase